MAFDHHVARFFKILHQIPLIELFFGIGNPTCAVTAIRIRSNCLKRPENPPWFKNRVEAFLRGGLKL